MITDRKGFLFLRSYFESIEKEMSDDKLKARAYRCIASYALLGEEPSESENESVRLIFRMAKPTIDSSIERYENCKKNGRKGGAPKGNTNAQKNNLKTTKKQPEGQPKNNLNKDMEKEKEKDKEDEDKKRDREKEKQFFLTLKNNYINITINTEQIDSTKYDLDKILKAIEQSQYLQGTTTAFILSHYDKVISGAYVDFKKPQEKSEFQQRKYTKEDLNAMFDNLDDIDI